ncbi:MAG: hypothetical protein NC342_09115 [Pseudoflavonifractor sp.]|nr:hypothetical protein [Pseudoflavonifractor sp.]
MPSGHLPPAHVDRFRPGATPSGHLPPRDRWPEAIRAHRSPLAPECRPGATPPGISPIFDR